MLLLWTVLEHSDCENSRSCCYRENHLRSQSFRLLRIVHTGGILVQYLKLHIIQLWHTGYLYIDKSFSQICTLAWSSDWRCLLVVQEPARGRGRNHILLRQPGSGRAATPTFNRQQAKGQKGWNRTNHRHGYPTLILLLVWVHRSSHIHYNDVIMSAMASQITSLTLVYSAVYSGADQRKHQSSTSLAFVRGIHRWPVNSLHKGPVMRKMFPFDDVIMRFATCNYKLEFYQKQFYVISNVLHGENGAYIMLTLGMCLYVLYKSNCCLLHSLRFDELWFDDA